MGNRANLNKSQARAAGRVLALLLAAQLTCQPLAIANVFGDGDPDNGSEDGRSNLTAASGGGWQNAAGTIHCDGELRGSGMLLAVNDEVVLVTAAHVLVDLDTAQSFCHCAFHHMAMHRLPGLQVSLDLGAVVSGGFDAENATDQDAFGSSDWAFVRLDPAWTKSLQHGVLHAVAWQDLRSEVVEYRLVAWYSGQGRMSISAPCQVQESQAGDLGGGSWAGQLLDDCDSGQGASGGGLLAQTEQGMFLVGIRTGSHWSPVEYPPRVYPDGPPDGSAWDVLRNTNFARALDQGIIQAIRAF